MIARRGVFVKQIGQVLAQFMLCKLAWHDEIRRPALAFGAEVKRPPRVRLAADDDQPPEHIEAQLAHSVSGKLRRRLPVSLNTALATAGAIGGVAGSPMPSGCSALGMMMVSTSGAWFMRTTG